jgi:uncharacterized protein involved in exopolysaccharide biosynthesis
VQIITQRVMTTENLLRILERYKLYEDIRDREPREVLVAKVRSNFGFKMISAEVIDPRSGQPTKATIAFSVSFKDRSANTAAQVANDLVSLYLQEHIENRKESTANAANFLAAEAERLNARITELQSEVAQFKEKNLNDLPELASLNLQILARAEDELRSVDTRLRSLEQQMVYLDAQLAQINPTAQIYTSTGERVMSPADRLKMLRAEQSRMSGLYSQSHPDLVRIERELAGLEKQVGSEPEVNDLERQLQAARTERAGATERYGREHPDVVRLERQIESLTLQLDTARAAGREATSAERAAGADNPGYIQIRAQREAAANERLSLELERKSLQAKIADFEDRLAKTPGVERDYMALVRELESTELKHREVRQKQMEAKVAQNLEDERKGERFSLIEPPLAPERPSSPNRKLILIMGVVLGVGVALGLTFLLETLDTSVRNKRDLEGLLAVAPLAVVPWIDTADDRRRRVRTRRLSLAGAVASLVAAVVFVHLFYRPLDVLWQVVLRRMG